MSDSSVVIIGGGAAGLCAAIAAARLGARVTVLEREPRVGKKILASGNGRCNLTNVRVSPSAYNHPDFVRPVLDRYTYEAVNSFFDELGLLTFADDEGRVYPLSNAASAVVDVLRLECAHLGVDVRCDREVTRIQQHDTAAFEVQSREGETFGASAIVVTTGVGALLTDLGLASVETRAVLGPVRTETGPIRGLSGVRVRCAATLYSAASDGGAGGELLATERGELLFRDYGVSGIMVFDLSRYLQPGCVMSIDLLPDTSLVQLQGTLEQRCANLGWRTAETFFAGMLHDRVARAILRAAGVDPSTPASALDAAALAAVLKGFRLEVLGMGDAKQAQVTRGGAQVTQFDPSTMASLRAAGVFAAGEVLDIDGRSGGFNLHWAWASGLVAGEAAARRVITPAQARDDERGMSE